MTAKVAEHREEYVTALPHETQGDIASVAKQSTSRSSHVTVVHVKASAAARFVGPAEGAPAALGHEQGIVLRDGQAVAVLETVLPVVPALSLRREARLWVAKRDRIDTEGTGGGGAA